MKPAAKQEKNVILCGVAVIRRGREFLIAQRKKNDSFGNYWEFPGGKKNAGEAFEDCAVREVREEIGIEIKVVEKLMDLRRPYNRKIIWLHFYLCSHVSGEPSAIDCQKVQWTDIAQLKNFRFPPSNNQVIHRLLERFGALS